MSLHWRRKSSWIVLVAGSSAQLICINQLNKAIQVVYNHSLIYNPSNKIMLDISAQDRISAPRVYGSLQLNYVMHIYLPLIILTPCYTYYMAVIKTHQCKPFPHATVTMTAHYYPQNIVFRYTMGIASAILVLIFSTIYRWINSRAERAGYPPMNRAIYYLIMLSIVFYCIAIESIDGAGEGPLHTPSAIIFFVVQEIAIVYITLYLYELREWDSSIISLKSMRLKALLAIYVSLVWIYCLYGTYGQSENSLDYSVIVEWNAVFVTLLWCLSFSLEWKDIKLSLVTSQKEALLMS